MNIQELAKQINLDCDNYNYFYAFGTIRETISLWDNQNRRYLNETALQMLEDIQ